MAPLHQSLDSLPQEVLILIVRHVFIDDIFALRLVCSSFESLIVEYSQSILPSVAHNTIPQLGNERLYERVRESNPTNRHDLRWLKSLIPAFLAQTLLAGPSYRNTKSLGWYSIPAHNELGNHLRSRLENGWRVLRQLSLISKDIYEPQMGKLANAWNRDTWKVIQNRVEGRLMAGNDGVKSIARTSGKQSDFTFINQKESMIFSRRAEFVKAMSTEDAADYIILSTALSKPLRYHPRFSSPEMPFFALTSSNMWTFYKYAGQVEGTPLWYLDWRNSVDICPIAPWTLWFIMHSGPDAFWHQWTSTYSSYGADNYFSDLAWSYATPQDERTTRLRIKLALDIEVAIAKKCVKPTRLKKTSRTDIGYLEQRLRAFDRSAEILVPEARLRDAFEYWAACGGANSTVTLDEDGQLQEQQMTKEGRHPRETLPFFVYLGVKEDVL